jgi:hypothetical protein
MKENIDPFISGKLMEPFEIADLKPTLLKDEK